MKTLSSFQNPEIKFTVALHSAKHRRAYNLCIIEGVRAVTTALDACMKLHSLFVTAPTAYIAQDYELKAPVYGISDELMKKISTATTPSGILGIFHIPVAKKSLGAGLVLANISDPGNMGTLIRTAAACSLRSVIVVEGVDPWSPKVIQSSAGTIAHVDIIQLSWAELLVQKKALELYALTPKGGVSIQQVTANNSLLVVGNEAHGLPEAWLSSCEHQVTLPMANTTESLNAAIAGSIALYITHVLSC